MTTTKGATGATGSEQFPAGTRILIVDDVRDIQEVLKLFLEYRGANVLTADNGTDALELALKEKPDLILMDMQLPDINGYIVTRRLRNRGFLEPIIAMTATTAQGGRELCLRAGCSDYLSKPVDLNNLMTKAGQHLRPKTSPHPHP